MAAAVVLAGGCFNEASDVGPDGGAEGSTAAAMSSAGSATLGAGASGAPATEDAGASGTDTKGWQTGAQDSGADPSDDSGTESVGETGSLQTVDVGPLPIASDVDDGQIRPGVTAPYDWFTSGETEGGHLGASQQGAHYAGYFRFVVPRAIPVGAVVVEARLSIVGRSVREWDATADALVVAVEDAADAPLVASGSAYPYNDNGNPGGVVLRPERVRWPESGGLSWAVEQSMNESPNFAAALQGIVDAYRGMTAGAHIQVWVTMPSELLVDGGAVGFYDYYEDPAHAATLSFRYAPPA